MAQPLVNRMLSHVGVVLLIFALQCSFAPAQGVTNKTTLPSAQSQSRKASTLESAIKTLAAKFVADFNRHDAKAVAAHWTKDGDYIDEVGQTYQGRAAIETEYANFFKAYPAVKMRVVVDSVRKINDTTLIEDGRAVIEPALAGAHVSSRYVAVHVKQGDQWLMKTVRDTRLETASNHRRLADLQWLIGAWETEHEGIQIDYTFSWRANKNYIERAFVVTKNGKPLSGGTQIIGWDPLQQQIGSRLFDHQGGHSYGLWSPTENGWIIETVSHSVDSVPSSAINSLSRLDENSLAWQSVDRVVGDQQVADTEVVVLTRK